jgi:hypothetical protein
MGTTHLRSNLKGQAGTQRIAAFAAASIGIVEATYLKVNTSATIPSVSANTVTASAVEINTGVTNYIKLGAHQYVLFGAESSESAIVADATAIDSNCATGTIYISTAGQLWIFDDNTTATQFQTF